MRVIHPPIPGALWKSARQVLPTFQPPPACAAPTRNQGQNIVKSRYFDSYLYHFASYLGMAGQPRGLHPLEMAHARGAPLNKSFGQNIRIFRAARGWSQEELAERAGIKRTYIGAIERGEIDPRLGTLAKIATGLGVEPFRLLQPVSEHLNSGR